MDSLVTLIPLLDSQTTDEYDLQGLFTEWAANDDVFRTEFLEGVVLYRPAIKNPTRLSYQTRCANTGVPISS